MKSKKTKKKPASFHISVGSLLMAKPFWGDEVFVRSVVLITLVEKDKVVGMIINKMSTMPVKEALPEIDSAEHIFFGGNTDSSEVAFFHTLTDLENAITLGSGLFLGGDPQGIIEAASLKTIDYKKIRFVAGHVEWTPEALEEEYKQNKWWLSTVTANDFFEIVPESLWSYKVLQSGHTYGLFAHIPDPSVKETVAEGFNFS